MLREMSSYSLFTILMVICLVLIAISKRIATKRFNDFISVIGNSNYLKIYSRDQKFLDYYDGLLFINLIISLGIFTIVSMESITGNKVTDQQLVFKIILGIGFFILIKVLIERLIGSLFKIDHIIDTYLFQKISYKNFLGLLLLPINALLIYSFNGSKNVIYTVLIILTLINLSGAFTTFKAYQNEIKNNLFYFILYLCALEFSPYIIICSIISF